MCEPVTMMVATAALSAYSLYDQKQTAKYNERMYRAAQKEQEQQIYSAKSAQASDRAIKARQERGRLRAVAAESGLSGLTTQDLFDNLNFQESTDLNRIATQGQFDQTNSRWQLQSNLQNIRQPDYAGTIANTGLSLYTMGQGAGMWGQPKP